MDVLQVTEGNATLAYRDADDEEEETWEDLLEMEENVWDPHAAQGTVMPVRFHLGNSESHPRASAEAVSFALQLTCWVNS